jgi:hypothetical protein
MRVAMIAAIFCAASMLFGGERAQGNPQNARPVQLKIDEEACPGDAFATTPHVLVTMFLVTTPATVKRPDWALQDVITQEFSSCAACYVAAATVRDSIQETPTINLAGWCFKKLVTERSSETSDPAQRVITLPKPLTFESLKEGR